MKNTLSLAFAAFFTAAPAFAQETAPNCRATIAPEAAAAEYVKLVLPSKEGAAGYSGPAYVLAFVGNDRARMGGSAYAARACTDPRKIHPDAVIYTVQVKEGLILLPVADGAGFSGRVDVPQAGKPRTEMSFFASSGVKEVSVAAPM